MIDDVITDAAQLLPFADVTIAGLGPRWPDTHGEQRLRISVGGGGRRRQQTVELIGPADVVIGPETGNRAAGPARLEQGTFQRYGWPRVAQGRLDDQVILWQIGQLFADKSIHAGTGGHVDVVDPGDRCDTRHRLLQHGLLAGHGVELLGSGLPAVGPQTCSHAPCTNDKFQHLLPAVPGAATR
ncbi:MAG: hypothetical protein O2782_16845 [bacterium]|nr:hypothetical protein [bacterium]